MPMLVEQVVFIELAPDRNSEQIVPELDHATDRCRSEKASDNHPDR